MGFRFRKSFKLAPGIRLNLGKKSGSLSLGGRGATLSVGSRGVYGNLGAPGTGLSYRTKLSGGEPTASHAQGGASTYGLTSATSPVMSHPTTVHAGEGKATLWAALKALLLCILFTLAAFICLALANVDVAVALVGVPAVCLGSFFFFLKYFKRKWREKQQQTGPLDQKIPLAEEEPEPLTEQEKEAILEKQRSELLSLPVTVTMSAAPFALAGVTGTNENGARRQALLKKCRAGLEDGRGIALVIEPSEGMVAVRAYIAKERGEATNLGILGTVPDEIVLELLQKSIPIEALSLAFVGVTEEGEGRDAVMGCRAEISAEWQITRGEALAQGLDIPPVPVNNAGEVSVSNDPLYAEAVCFVREQGQASISLVQRKFRIGFMRATRLIEQMEQDGIIGPADGSRPRPVL